MFKIGTMFSFISFFTDSARFLFKKKKKKSVVIATFHLREIKCNPGNVVFVSSESRGRTELADDVPSLKSFSNFQP